MSINVLTVTARSAAFELNNESCYYTNSPYQVKLNQKVCKTNQQTNVFSLFQLIPDTDYEVEICFEEQTLNLEFHTAAETAFVNVKRFGACGDGLTDDTLKIQAAMMACPKGGTVYVPKGRYLCASLFVPSDITLYLDRGAVILGTTERKAYPILPGVIPTTDENKEFYLGSWEGNPLDSFAGLINMIGSSHAYITGEGTIDAQAQNGDWYQDAKVKRIAWRPKLFFASKADHIMLHGVTLMNSYCWTIHPLYCDSVDIIDITVKNPEDSPNTDGMDPEGCSNVRILGNRIHVGDDCIVIKSGKLFLGRLLKKPCENVVIRNCLMERGHGGLVLGSEMSGGIRNVMVTRCIMDHTDRGLRIKSRRGRGKDAIISGLTFKNVIMQQVLAPFVVNMFYYCDPDGLSDYVQCRQPLPVDERTPKLGELTFEDIRATGAEYAGCCFLGLPESPIEKITMKDVQISFADEARAGEAAMAGGFGTVSKLAFLAENVTEIQMENVTFDGYEGEQLVLKNVGSLKEV